MKKWCAIFLAGLLLLTACNNENKESTRDLTEKETSTTEGTKDNDIITNKKEIADAYLNVINAYEEERVKEIGDAEGIVYNLIYLDDDDIPELVISLLGFRASIYTYNDGRVYNVMDNWGYGAGGNSGYFYIPGENVIRNEDSEAAGAMVYTTFYKMNDQFQLESYYPNYLWTGYADGQNVYEVPRYFYGSEEISEEEFNSYLIEGDYQTIVGEMTKDEVIDKLTSDITD